MHSILLLLSHFLKILWENCFRNDAGNDCLISVDGVDFRILGRKLKNGKPDPEYCSCKFKAAGLRCEIGLCIRTSDIVWTAGPFKPGICNDIEMFRRPLGLKSSLPDGERVEADDGHVGECPACCKCPGSDTSHLRQKKMRARVRMRHERVDERIKNFGSMSSLFRHGVTKHGLAMRAAAILAQLSMESGEKLMRLPECDDRLTDNEVMVLYGV